VREPSLPEEVRKGVLEALADRCAAPSPPEIAGTSPMGGGCVNPSVRIRTTDGSSYFLKWNVRHPELFPAEARGLEALAAVAAVRTPYVVAASGGTGQGGAGWLLLEWIAPGEEGPRFGRRLGRGLAELHRPGDGGWGWDRDNYLGPLPQTNRIRATWGEFWRDERLRPQLRGARKAGLRPGSEEEWERLFSRIEELVAPAEEEGPSLLHGDLWHGNVLADRQGRPVLIDPAVYRGHREVDLAMTELFGGFSRDFYRAYEEARPLRPGYRERRRDLYQLYPLLVHVNLFGGGYLDRTARTLRRILSRA